MPGPTIWPILHVEEILTLGAGFVSAIAGYTHVYPWLVDEYENTDWKLWQKKLQETETLIVNNTFAAASYVGGTSAYLAEGIKERKESRAILGLQFLI